MSRLDDLIEKYCPDGVEYRALGELCSIKTGKLNANAMVPDGEYPFFTCSSKPSKINTYAFDTDAILLSGNGDANLHRYKGKFNAYQRTYVLFDFSKEVLKGFVYFYLDNNLKDCIFANSKKGTIPYISLPMLTTFLVPLPPLPVQEEIVRILDTFTELEKELEKELVLRRKQYEYYRDLLLDFRHGDGEAYSVPWLAEMLRNLCPQGVEYRKLGELVNYEQPSKYIVNSTKYRDEYTIPVLTAGQTFILGFTDELYGVYLASKDNPVIIFDDFTASFKWVDFNFKVKSSAIKILTVKGNITTIRYIYHVMSFLDISSDEHKRLWIGMYSNIKVPLPPARHPAPHRSHP